MEHPETQAAEKQPFCVLMKVKNSIYAIDSGYVENLFLLDHEVVPMPGSSSAYVGMIQYRGGALPLFDMRELMGLESQDSEILAFDEMLDARKQDHVRWVDELHRCLREDEPFHLATDPHKCAFGKWYDNYKPDNQVLGFYLNKVADPHAKLHETAIKAINAVKALAPEEREKYIRDTIISNADSYKSRILSVLDQVKQAHRESQHRMVIVLSGAAGSCGLLADEVLAVETLSAVEKGNTSGKSGLIDGIMKSGQRAELILMLNGELLLSTLSAEIN